MDTNTSSDDGERLKAARDQVGLSQEQLAQRLGISQKQVSLMERGLAEPSPEARRFSLEPEIFLQADPRAAVRPARRPSEGVLSHTYSLQPATFRRLWQESPKRAEHMALEAVVKKSSSKGTDKYFFADVDLKIIFEGLRVPKNELLYLDCVGLVPDLTKEGNRWFFSEATGSVVTLEDSNAKRADIKEDDQVRLKIGPYATAYKIANADPNDSIVVTLRGERACKSNQVDSAGIPVYPDCVIRKLSVSVTFEDLKPTPDPSAQVWLLRRTLGDGRPLDLSSDIDLRVAETRNKFQFKHLLYPKPGYGYCIAWGGLERL